jgi:hypothetical protein
MRVALAVTVLRIGVRNRNGRTYTREAVEGAVASAPELITGKLGMDYDPDAPGNDCREVTHTCSNLRVEGDRLVADILFRDTVEGRMLESSFRAGNHLFRTASFAARIVDGTIHEFRLSSVNAVIATNAS